MRNRHSNKLCTTFAVITLITILLSLTSALLPISKAILETDPVTGAIWTTDPNGERVNGNLYTNAKNVYLSGGPHKEGAAGLPDGVYYFQVTDPPGKTLLSSDPLWKRRFEVKDGYIYSIDGGTHKWNNDTTRGYGIVVQLWPFTYTPNKGGVYKVWVTEVEHYTPNQGCFGFIHSLSKTDNFKVKLEEAPKYFELWVTEGISRRVYIEFYVNYTVDGDGNPATVDPVLPWTTGQLIYDRTENGYDVFRYETSFPMGSYIYWKFFTLNDFEWVSDTHGPELINQEGMVNKEILFVISGHKYSYPDNTELEGWTVELYKDGLKIAEAQTGTDGYYEFIGLGPGDYTVCEVPKSDEGWAPFGPTCYEFTVDGNNGHDFTFDFYNYEMLQITDTSDCRLELSSFDLVFTPSNEGPGMYKLSSTNPGSFYTNVVLYHEAGLNVRMEIGLPSDKENAVFDSPNFILHHTYIGSSPVIDVHVYAGRLESGSGWVPDWSKDVTNSFDITATSDGKHVTVEGVMPYTGVAFVTVHIDYQISGSLMWSQIQMFRDFEYIFSVDVYASMFGVTRKFAVNEVSAPTP
jgi:hypothetical protein